MKTGSLFQLWMSCRLCATLMVDFWFNKDFRVSDPVQFERWKCGNSDCSMIFVRC